jgi:hypothetical protein
MYLPSHAPDTVLFNNALFNFTGCVKPDGRSNVNNELGAVLRICLIKWGGGDRVGGITTLYGLDGPGIEFWWGRDFPHTSRPAPGPTQWVPGLARG